MIPAPAVHAVPGAAAGCGLPATITAGAASIFGQAVPGGVSAGAQNPYTLATQFSLSRAAAMQGVWWYSYASATALPSICGAWDLATQAAVAEDAAPAWVTGLGGSLAAAGSGWVFCDFTAAGVKLAGGVNYAVAVFQPSSGVAWWCTEAGYWTPGSGLPGQYGITSGVIAAPDTVASVNGQGCWNTSGAWAFPGASPGNGEVFFADIQVYG